MSEAVVAKRYAEALFQLATEQNIEDNISSELTTVKDVFQNDEQINGFLDLPRITDEEKMNVLDAVFKDFDRNVINTLKLLVERDRMNIVSALVDEYTDLYNEAKGIANATVYSTRALSDDEKAQLEASFKKRFNKQQITIDNKIDPSLLGGLRIRVGNTIYDGSLNNKLNRMKHNVVSETI